MSRLKQHASSRMQQRGIKSTTAEYLLSCGSRDHDHRGATILYFDKHARQRLLNQLGAKQLKTIEQQLDTYAVVSGEGEIITVGHRTKRINRH